MYESEASASFGIKPGKQRGTEYGRNVGIKYK